MGKSCRYLNVSLSCSCYEMQLIEIGIGEAAAVGPQLPLDVCMNGQLAHLTPVLQTGVGVKDSSKGHS